ncbi:MAG: hypothetical protein AAGH79_06530 [Bacteroidota bacterium]
MLRNFPQRIYWILALVLIISGRPIALGQLDVLNYLDPDSLRVNNIQAVYAVDAANDTLFQASFDIAGKPLQIRKKEKDGWKRSSFRYQEDQVLESIVVNIGYDSLVQQFQYPANRTDWISKKRRFYVWDADKGEYVSEKEEEWIRKMIDGRILQEMYFVSGEPKEVTLHQYWAGYLIRKTTSALQPEGPPKLLFEITYDYDLQQRPIAISERWHSISKKETRFQYFERGKQLEESVHEFFFSGEKERSSLTTWGKDSLLLQLERTDSTGAVLYARTEHTYLDTLGKVVKILRQTTEAGLTYDELEILDGKWCALYRKVRFSGEPWREEFGQCPTYSIENGWLTKISWPKNDMNNFNIFLFYKQESPPKSNE